MFKKFTKSEPLPEVSASNDETSSSSSSSSDAESVLDKSLVVRKELSEDSEKVAEFLEEYLEDFAVKKDFVENDMKIDSTEEEVYLLQTPKSFDPHSLIGKKINLKKRTKFANDGENYEIRNYLTRKLTRAAITKYRGSVIKLSVFEPQGLLIVKENLKDQELDTNKLEDFLVKFEKENEATVKMPKKLKVRHPLLGVDYEDELKSRKVALERLVPVKKEHKSPSKKKKRKAVEAFEEQLSPMNSPRKKKPKKEETPTIGSLQWLQDI